MHIARKSFPLILCLTAGVAAAAAITALGANPGDTVQLTGGYAIRGSGDCSTVASIPSVPWWITLNGQPYSSGTSTAGVCDYAPDGHIIRYTINVSATIPANAAPGSSWDFEMTAGDDHAFAGSAGGSIPNSTAPTTTATPTTTAASPTTTTTAAPTHYYANGDYFVTLQVVDAGGLTSVAVHEITVSAATVTVGPKLFALDTAQQTPSSLPHTSAKLFHASSSDLQHLASMITAAAQKTKVGGNATLDIHTTCRKTSPAINAVGLGYRHLVCAIAAPGPLHVHGSVTFSVSGDSATYAGRICGLGVCKPMRGNA